MPRVLRCTVKKRQKPKHPTLLQAQGTKQAQAKPGRMRTMPPMSFSPQASERLAFYRAVAASLAIHAIALALPHAEPSRELASAAPLQARLAPRVVATPPVPEVASAPVPNTKTGKQKKPREILAVDRSHNASRSAPTWTAAQKTEMDNFLNELADEAKRKPPPTLAQRSLAMAREVGREMARADEAGEALLELRPNGPPANPFSLEFYLDGLVRRLNRSAGFVNAERKHKGVQTAAVQFRLNPDGTLKSFVVLNAADQADEIAFIKAVVERSVPFSPFPPDIDKAARSLGVTICIQPGRNSEPGFTRMQGGRCL